MIHERTHFNRARLADAIGSYIARRDMTLRDAAKECGVSASTLCRCLGEKAPDVDSLGRIAHWLGFTTDFFYGVGGRKESR